MNLMINDVGSIVNPFLSIRQRGTRKDAVATWGGQLAGNTLIPQPLPSFMTSFPNLIQRLQDTGAFRGSKHGQPNHCLVNEYLAGQGIMNAGFSERKALHASLGFGALNFVFAFPGLVTIDTFGRRSLLLVGFPVMALFLLVCSMSFLAPNGPATPEFYNGVVGPGKLAGIAIGIYLFSCVYSFTEGPVPFTYSAEVFPLAQRQQGMAWAVATCLFWAAVLSITFPAMLNVMKPWGAILFYAVNGGRS
ncbi:hypothetical protein OC835_006728 [Tilletia horrida]|nr:hypothetical protein OC835_006728 [Tilletia horrida]